MDEFARRETREPGINQRIVPVQKLPHDSAQLPPLIQGRSGFHFYEQDPVSQKLLEFYRRGKVREDYENDYADLFDEMAGYICVHLPEHTPHAKVDNPPLSAAVFTVFVVPGAAVDEALRKRLQAVTDVDQAKADLWRVITLARQQFGGKIGLTSPPIAAVAE